MPGIDEDWSKADPATLKAHGFAFVIGYVSEDTTGKNITRAQIDALHAAQLDVAFVYEYAPDAALLGSLRGTRNAATAVHNAAGLGVPTGTCIYFAVDFNATGTQLITISDYIRAARNMCLSFGYKTGVYAEYEVVKYLLDHGYVDYAWQTYAWSNGKWDPRAVLRQTHNGEHVGRAVVDLDYAQNPEFGQWRWNGSAGSGDTVGTHTDSIIAAWSSGKPTADDGTQVDPVIWQQRFEAWQNTVSQAFATQGAVAGTMIDKISGIEMALQALATQVANLGTGMPPSQSDQAVMAIWERVARSLETIADALRPPQPALPPLPLPEGPVATVEPPSSPTAAP